LGKDCLPAADSLRCAQLIGRTERSRGARMLACLALMVPLPGLTEPPHYPNDRYSYFVSLLWAVAITEAGRTN
jgi:hypothetical protein